MTTRALTLLLASLALTAGCRTTHEADEGEHQNLRQVDGGLQSGSSVQGDQGQSSVTLLSSVYAPLLYLSDKDRADGTSSAAIVHSERELALLRESTLLDDGSRDEFPECVQDSENSVTYADCSFGASAGGASVGFSLDGTYTWSEFSSTADLLFDFGVSAAGLGVGTSFDWQHDLAWTDEKLDGTFDLDYGAGVSLGGMQTATSIRFTVGASIEELVGAEDCEGPVAGVVDWRSTYREGTDPVENRHVTVEWVGCEDALVTW